MADNLDAARTFGARMRALGCAVALHDFGVGHGTFTYLKHLRVDYLKIDMQFVRHLRQDDEDRQVVQAIIGVARQFKIKTIAEGVEDQQEALDDKRETLALPTSAQPEAADLSAVQRGAVERARAARERAETALVRAQAAMVRAQAAEARAQRTN